MSVELSGLKAQGWQGLRVCTVYPGTPPGEQAAQPARNQRAWALAQGRQRFPQLWSPPWRKGHYCLDPWRRRAAASTDRLTWDGELCPVDHWTQAASLLSSMRTLKGIHKLQWALKPGPPSSSSGPGRCRSLQKSHSPPPDLPDPDGSTSSYRDSVPGFIQADGPRRVLIVSEFSNCSYMEAVLHIILTQTGSLKWLQFQKENES